MAMAVAHYALFAADANLNSSAVVVCLHQSSFHPFMKSLVYYYCQLLLRTLHFVACDILMPKEPKAPCFAVGKDTLIIY